MKIVAINLQPSAVGWHRTWMWCKALREMGHTVWDNPDQPEQFSWDDIDKILDGADVVLTAQMTNPQVFAALLAGRDLYKYKLVVDTDDNVDCIPKYNQAFAEGHPGVGLSRIMRAQLKAADLVTVSTRNLLPWAKQYARRAVLIENVIDMDSLSGIRQREKEPRHADDERIYWGGGGGHYDDLLMIKDAVIRLMGERPKLKMIFGNFIPGWAVDFPTFRLFRIPMVPFHKYPKVLSWLKVDVALAPLVDNSFNIYKSNVKYLFHSLAGISGVYSDLSPYECVEHGVTGLKAKTENDWYMCIKELLDSKRLRNEIGTAAQLDVMNRFTLKDAASHYEQMLEELVSFKTPEVVQLVEGEPVEAACLTLQS